MHKTFSFTPELPRRFTKGRLLSPVKTVGTSLAGVALRSYCHVSRYSGDVFPGLKLGRIHLPRPLISSHANIFGETGPPRLPMQIIETHRSSKDDKSARRWLALFTDRSALVMREEVDCGQDLTHPLMRVLPVILKLTSKAEPLHRNTTYSLAVIASEDRGASHG